MSDTTESLRAEEPTEAWVVEVCVLGREKVGPWRVEFLNTRERAEEQTAKWNAERPAGYSHRVRRYIPEARLEAAEQAIEETAFILAYRPGDITHGRAFDLALARLRRHNPNAGRVATVAVRPRGEAR